MRVGENSPTWTELAQLSVAVLSSLGGFLLPPPRFLEASTQPWPIHFVVAVLSGLLVLAGRRRRGKRDAALWAAAALGALAAALAALLAHRFLVETWTCPYYGTLRITGSELTPYATEYLTENPVPSCEELLKIFTGRREEIWTPASLVRNELLLAMTYLSVVPLLAVCAIATLQAFRCGHEEHTR